MATLILLVVLLLPFLVIGGAMALFFKRKRRAILRWSGICYLIAVVSILLGVGPYLSAWWLVTHGGTRPQDREIRETPRDHGLAYEDIVFDARDSLHLSGWFIAPTRKNSVLLCTHGLFRNRIEMLDRAVAACKAGYGALLYDSRSHGASEKGLVSLGYYERNDVLGGIQYIRRRYQDSPEQPKIVLMGISMGAVATLEAAAESKDYAAIILDSPFSSLRETIVDHSWLFFGMPRYPFPSLFIFWFQHLAGFDADQVNSHVAIRNAQPVPLLIIASEGDNRISIAVAKSLYRESGSAVRELKVFGRDVSHGAAARLHPDLYSDLLVNFLGSALAAVPGANGVRQGFTTTSAKEGFPK